nr:hypothetical protein [Anoxybacillus sp. ST4]
MEKQDPVGQRHDEGNAHIFDTAEPVRRSIIRQSGPPPASSREEDPSGLSPIHVHGAPISLEVQREDGSCTTHVELGDTENTASIRHASSFTRKREET